MFFMEPGNLGKKFSTIFLNLRSDALPDSSLFMKLSMSLACCLLCSSLCWAE